MIVDDGEAVSCGGLPRRRPQRIRSLKRMRARRGNGPRNRPSPDRTRSNSLPVIMTTISLPVIMITISLPSVA